MIKYFVFLLLVVLLSCREKYPLKKDRSWPTGINAIPTRNCRTIIIGSRIDSGEIFIKDGYIWFNDRYEGKHTMYYTVNDSDYVIYNNYDR